MVPWLVGTAPFGLVNGIGVAQADVPTFAGWLAGPLIFAGSAQVATISMLDGGAAPLVVIVAALAINLRLVMYSARRRTAPPTSARLGPRRGVR